MTRPPFSLDGTFRCGDAVRRLLARCPRLASHQVIATLATEVDDLELNGGCDVADRVASALAEPLLHPSYTIPVVGCFRPLSRKILDRAVDQLQSHWRRLVSNWDCGGGDVEEVGEGDVEIIGFYVTRRRGIRVHELASVLKYFGFSHPPFERLRTAASVLLLMEKDCHLLLDSVRISLRLLLLNPDIISKIWNCGGRLERPFVLTSAVKKGVEMVLMALGQNCPVLLHGPAGSGKTGLIRKLAEINQNQDFHNLFSITTSTTCQNPYYGSLRFCNDTILEIIQELFLRFDLLFIHMDDQMDSKMLVGSYVCSEQPGEFRWQPGSLTQAVLNGFWVLFEDIDKSPAEVQSILLPLLEGARSFVTVHGEAVNVAESFRLFATISGSKPSLNAEGGGSFSRLWRKVMLGAPSNEDLARIMHAWYPSLDSISIKLTGTLESVNYLTSVHYRAPQLGVLSTGVTGKFSTRHLLKWCKRIIDLGINFSCPLSMSYCKKIYQEAVDIFASSLPTAGERLAIMRDIANIWGISQHEIETLCLSNKPVIQDMNSYLQVGRVTLQHAKPGSYQPSRPFANLRSSLHILEKIACSVRHNEPVLLVGETGTGKTTLVQNLAMRLGQPLTVLNLSQQSDPSDLLGGFKPSNTRSICIPLYHEFLELFRRTFSVQGNEELLRRCKSYRDREDWKKLLSAFVKCVKSTLDIFSKRKENYCGSKRKRLEELPKTWECFSSKLESAYKQISTSHMSFSFVEGAFITSVKMGHWILLDEVNLAPQETLQRVIGVLDGENGTLCLVEKGDVDYVVCHPSFRIFCCMNPANDAGKRDLPHSFRSRFTEYFVDDVLDDSDLRVFVNQYLDEAVTSGGILDRIVQFYKMAKKSEESLQDGANQKPQFSLRSLARALEYGKTSERKFGLQRALYDGFSMFFVTSLDGPSGKIMSEMIISSLLAGSMPHDVPFEAYLETFNLSACGVDYVLTSGVKDHLRNLARAVYAKRYPVLLQGPTSSGKTSLVQFLASITGNKFVRINNHEHTDLQEYFGSYITNSFGRLEFQEGVLVEAVRKGYWVVLDELNLAPSDVLEALNRLLDDNRELFVPELQETVVAHPDFMLFATQNPPTLYAGRKVLSRAFRNRFLEIHVDEIPENELAEILEKRCKIPLSYAKKMVEVMKDLQLHRQNSKVFSGKHGFITSRDLFRWANRFQMFGKSYMDLALDGYLLLAERLREESEKDVVQDILERRLRVKLSKQDLYIKEPGTSDSICETQKRAGLQKTGKVIMTQSMWRLYFLVERCYKLREPVLLVGETGGGKTTVCQLLSAVIRSRLHILNCHQYTEASDFIGGFHPVRDRSRLTAEYHSQIEKAKDLKFFCHYCQEVEISFDIGQAPLTISCLKGCLENLKDSMPHCDISQKDVDDFQLVIDALVQLELNWQAIFLWQDGPLVQAMKNGDLFLVDEISLADDSVLERLNSVLEPERTLSLAEKGGSSLEKVTAHPDFFIFATMNPGGDYGKKELSPALRNRFTEIWVSSVSEIEELRFIACERFVKSELTCFSEPMIKFWDWFNQLETGRILTVRDLISWVTFINETEENLGSVQAFLHGAFLIVLDGVGLGTNISKCDASRLRESCLDYLVKEAKQVADIGFVDSQLSNMESYGWKGSDNDAANEGYNCVQAEHLFGIHPFYITKGRLQKRGFEFLAPTTCRNSLRLLRAMQLRRPVLLEGSPGVGKTSLVVALAEFSGHDVVRINLSEQTDMMDLLGSDLPVPGDNGMQFAWSDGILLQALKNGSWVLLDELNLAPQSVLEGLNAILDHRAEVYIPELACSFQCPSSFRVFACQNPTSQGGGRKGLPKSFLNRFTKVYADELSAEDYYFICNSLHPSVPTSLLSKLINFNSSPWEFNLRDVIRACQIIEDAPVATKEVSFLNTVYIQRMRTSGDREEVLKLYKEIFGRKPLINQIPRVQINANYVIVGSVSIPRNHFQPTKTSLVDLNILPSIRQCLEASLQCVQHQWLCILVGPSSSGKTSLVQLLAQLTGNALHELNLSSGTDVSELLGCFEQYNAFQSCTAIVSQIECCMGEYCGLRVQSSWEKLLTERKDLIAKWWDLLASMNDKTSGSSSEFVMAWNRGDCKFLNILVEIIEQLKLDSEKYSLPVSWSNEVLTRSLRTVLDLQKKVRKLGPGNFEWVNGRLIKAIECGNGSSWIMQISVLDRINSLVEPHGFITVNERGLLDGSPVVLHAHPKFRMFISFDPTCGEISRAMRNRGVEIFMPEQNLIDDSETNSGCQDAIGDLKQFLIQSGIPFYSLIEAMSEAHMYAKTVGLRLGVHITLLELRRWVQLFQQLLMSGNQSMWSLQLSWEHTYLTSLGEAEGEDIIMHVKHSLLSLYKDCPLMGSSLCLPGGWPLPQKLSNFIWFSQEATIKQNCMYLAFFGAQCASYEMSLSSTKTSLLSGYEEVKPLIFPFRALHQLLFPCGIDLQQAENFISSTFDLVLGKKILFISSNWVIEQATGKDLQLYIQWFQWSFSMILEQEQSHPIWSCIVNCWKEVTIYHEINVDQQYLPLVSKKVAELAGLIGAPNVWQTNLCNAIRCIGVLRLSLEQWNAERNYVFKAQELNQIFLPILKSLRHLEEEVLNVITESCSFDDLYESYSGLLEQHRSFWKCIMLPLFSTVCNCLAFSEEGSTQMKRFFPAAVHNLLYAKSSSKLGSSEKVTVESSSAKTLLWKHGGHPLASPSADVFDKNHQIFSLCADIWPKKTFWELLRRGICMSTYLIKVGRENDDTQIIWMKFIRRAEHERNNLTAIFMVNKENPTCHVAKTLCTNCCMFNSEILRGKAVIDCWLQSRPLFDRSSLLLDIELLQELTESCTLNSKNLFEVLSRMSEFLQYALDYSLKLSSRSPIDFSPHQKILWMLDAWTSIGDVHTKIANFVHQMWFNWHSSLWYCCSELDKVPYKIILHCLLTQPIRFDALDQILQGTHSISEYDAYRFKLRVTSRNLYQDALPDRDMLKFLHAAARSLFRQEQNFKGLKTLLLSSSCNSLILCVDSLIEPLVTELYSEYQQGNAEYIHNLGLAWVYLGLLRFHLLLNLDCPDPAMKYSFKYSQIVERISMLELEIKVRWQCENLAGKYLPRDEQDDRVCLLKKLEEEKKKLQAKVVFRPNIEDFENLKTFCAGFLGSDFKFPCNLRNMDEVQNWQVKSAQFIHQLSEKFGAYIDIIQPVQVAIYEIKLGMTLFMSSALENEYLTKLDQSRDEVLETIYSMMQFPRSFLDEFTLSDLQHKKTACFNVNAFCHILKKLSDNSTTRRISLQQLEAVVHHLNLTNVAHHVWTSQIMDDSSFSLLNKVFDRFAKLWFGMKFQVKMNKDLEDQYFKFKPRAIRIDEILKIDMLSMSEVDSDGNFAAGLEDMFVDTEVAQVEVGPCIEKENLEEEWNQIPEPLLKSMLNVHNQLFGSGSLYEYFAILLVFLSATTKWLIFCSLFQAPISNTTNEEKLQLFLDSFDLGTCLLKGLPTSISATLDEKLVIEQVLRVSLESEENMSSLQLRIDPNASAMSKMVEPLLNIQQRVKCLLSEWSDHPALQKLFDVTEMLLSVPLEVPLYKALCGLESLLVRIHSLQEILPKFSIGVTSTDLVEPIYSLVYAWQKIELDCWPKLLDGTEEQYELNAGKLWFPLHSVLHRKLSGDADRDNAFTVQSVEEFVQTSSLGEFSKRLKLLLAFHGQFNTAVCLNVCERVIRHIEAEKNGKMEEIKNQIKLLKWKQPKSRLSMERFRAARHKLCKTVKKFNDFLQQPMMIFLNQETNVKNRLVTAWFKQKPNGETDGEPVPFPSEPTYIGAIERLMNNHGWSEKVKLALEAAHVRRASEYIDLQYRDISNPIRLSSFTECQAVLSSTSSGWASLEQIYGHAIAFSHVWKNATKNLKKRRSLADLLKTLEATGLSRHRALQSEMSNQSSTLLLQSSYDVQHLLFQETNSSISLTDDGQMLRNNNFNLEWKKSNRCYFKNIALLQEIRQARLNFHKDLSLEQVCSRTSFPEKLICEDFVIFRTWGSTFILYQSALFECMWKQKKLFDMLVVMSKDMSLLMQCIGNSHLIGCQIVKDEAVMISTFLDRHNKYFVKSKELLDKYLLGRDGVTTSVKCKTPFIVSKQMEILVMQNFRIIHSLEDDINNFSTSKVFQRSISSIVLDRFKELITKGKLMEEELFREVGENQPTSSCQEHNNVDGQNFLELDAAFTECYKLSMFSKEDSPFGDVPAEKITSWDIIFRKYVSELQLDLVYESLSETLVKAVELLYRAGNKNAGICARAEAQLKHLYQLLDLFLSFADAVLLDFLAVHSAIAQVSQTIAQIFAFLFSEGFGGLDDPADDASGACQEATGTGMGEGEGANDQNDGAENADKAPSKTDKGIEMEEDFAADTSTSEEDVNVESVMGQGDDSSQVVDEKLWDNEEDGDGDKAAEKYESGPGVDEKEPSSMELRGKDAAATDIDESGDLTDDMPERLSGEEENPGDRNGLNAAFEEPTGIELDEKGRQEDSGEADMDEAAGSDTLDEQAEEDVEDGGDQNSGEDYMDLNDTDETEPKNDPWSEKDSAEPAHDSFAASQSVMAQAQWSNSADLQASYAPSNSGHGEVLSVDEPERRPVEDNPPSLQRTAPNPYRSLGDAMEEWKERVKFSDDPQDPEPDVPNQQGDGVGDEYQFVPEMEKGSSQTLGPATYDQIDQNIEKKDSLIKDHVNEEDFSEHRYMKRLEASASREQESSEESGKKMPNRAGEIISREELGDLVSFETYSMAELPPQSEDPAADRPVRMAEIGGTPEGLGLDPLLDWKRYERKTMRLSQELCEQLRLVMEPTLASKLQGDYKTGKRINMKKVIPYIASHFRKDKIWLRRTKPNKRDYQVVVAVDDSRSMSESHCGGVAIEALVTICRAIREYRLLHDFDQPFTVETGAKIISSLSFKQDNTVRDEPVVDLLKYLDGVLDTAVARARLPSGANPLNQLILIIADGRFQDKASRQDILNKRRMIAFVLLDNPKNPSWISRYEYSFVGGKFSCTKYMDSFPFPYYVVLRHIEALPRTVSDLLRQWFQLMLSSGE
ncbi:unnamed protein product [Spirodela intermedia]|uniref:Midasin n=1 Tax=Spirodela intermedia TaxID=51605 RepID=A0A7I8JKH9_SPIIN|nr:unnamed protein product [Spirodela intermedia]CAA6669952.1 unnamed protein product [Spirodela intermedia]